MIAPTVSIFLWLLPSDLTGHLYCSPDIWTQLIFYLFKIEREISGLVNDFWEAIFIFFPLPRSSFFSPSIISAARLYQQPFYIWQNKRPNEWGTYGDTYFKLLTFKQVRYYFLLWEHDVINSLVLCGWTGLFPKPKENALEVLSGARTISTDIYLTI